MIKEEELNNEKLVCNNCRKTIENNIWWTYPKGVICEDCEREYYSGDKA